MKLRIEPLTITIIMVVILLLTSGCSFISLKSPTSETLIRTATFLAGYEIGKNKPELAKEVIEYTQVDREDIVGFYDSWKRYLASRLGTDPVHRKLIEEMLALVDFNLDAVGIDPELKGVALELYISAMRKSIIVELFTEFVEGLEIGIDANLPE